MGGCSAATACCVKKYFVSPIHFPFLFSTTNRYGFLSENEQFAQALADEGVVFVGPTPDNLNKFGNKVKKYFESDDWNVAK